MSRIAEWREKRTDERERAFVERMGSVNEITAGTVLEYDDWQWGVVSELAQDRDVPKIGFVLVDELSDDIVERLEQANGCRQHHAAIREFRDSGHEYWTPVEYVIENDVWTVLGPVHPDYRDGGSK